MLANRLWYRCDAPDTASAAHEAAPAISSAVPVEAAVPPTADFMALRQEQLDKQQLADKIRQQISEIEAA